VSRHHRGAGRRVVFAHQCQKHERRSDQRLEHHEQERKRCGAPGRMSALETPERADQERDHQKQAEARSHAMGELDRGLDRARQMRDLTLASRPVLTAARS